MFFSAFSYPSATALMAAHWVFTHDTCVMYTCVSPTQSSELLEAVRPDLEVRVDPQLSLYRCSVNAGGRMFE